MPYRSKQGRMATAASLLIPYGIVIIFIAICLSDKGGKYDFSSSVEVDWLFRITLIIHGLYFVGIPFSYELSIESIPGPLLPDSWKPGKIPAKPDNLFWQLTCMTAELFFVMSVVYFLIASQDYVQDGQYLYQLLNVHII